MANSSKKRRDAKGRILTNGEGQRKDGTYYYRYKKPNAKNYSYIYSKDLKQLRKREEELERKMIKGDSLTDMTFGELATLWLSLKQNIDKQTEINYYNYLKSLEKTRIWNTKLSQIKTIHLKQLFLEMHKEGFAYSTISKRKSIIKQILDIGVESDLLAKNPCIFRLETVLKRSVRARIALTIEEQGVLKDAPLGPLKRRNDSYEFFRELFILMIETGLRIGEVQGLRKKDVNFMEKSLTIERQVQYLDNQGFVVKAPKTEAGKRKIPLSNRAVKVLEYLIRRVDTMDRFYFDGADDYICLSNTGGFLTKRAIDVAYKKLVKRINEMYPDIYLLETTPHYLRHTYCTNLCTAGVSLKAAQYLMGHANVQVTANIYTHVSSEYVFDEIQKLNCKLWD